MTYIPNNVWVELHTLVDGLPTWTSISGDVVSPIKVSTGFSNGDPLARLAPGGDMRFDLDNTASAYDPSTTFYKGQKIRLRIKYGSLVKTKFFGYIDHIGLDPGTWGARQSHVTCVDWLALAANTPIRALAGLTNTTIDLAIAALLAQMQIQPEALDLEIGDINLPSVFDKVTENSTVYSELQNLVMGEWGYIYMRDGGETLKCENSTSRTGDGSDYVTTDYYLADGVATNFLLEDNTSFLLEDNTNFQLEGEPTAGSFDSDFGQTYKDIQVNHGDQLVNKISAFAIPVVVGGSVLTLYPFSIATGSKALLIPTNSADKPYILQGQYKDPTAGGAQVSGSDVVTPVVSTDWTFNSKADGTGTDLSGNITITFTDGRSGFKALIVNSGASGYMTKFNVRGIPVYRYSPVETVTEDPQSIWDYGDYSLQFTRQYGETSDDIQPYIFRLLMRDRKPRTIFSNPKFNAYDEQDNLAGFLALDIGYQIRLASTKPASDSLYYIQGVKFTIQPGSEAITFDYVTTETLAGAPVGVTEVAVEQTLNTQKIDFGYLSSVSNHTYRTVTGRLYIQSLVSGDSFFSISGIVSTGYELFIFESGGNWSIALEINNGTGGRWRQSSSYLSAGAWFDFAVTMDISSTANNPTFYINGSATTTTTLVAPTDFGSETGKPLIIGNGFYDGVLGKIENVAVYDRILSAAEITTIHNGGTRLPFASYPQTNLKFFFGGMDTDDYTTKLNSTLGASDTVYDLVNGFAGQPINSPTLRAVG